MAKKNCMNNLCGGPTTAFLGEWKTGWELRSGGLAILCYPCGYAYEQGHFCEEYHQVESGWRSCMTCGKRLHCGCIASRSKIVLLVNGGVQCVGCASKGNVSGNGLDGPTTQPPPKPASARAGNSKLGTMPLCSAGRPPVEKRRRAKVFNRYIPRITDQELQEMSGNSNCTLVPLFEKVLSASDVGGVGRLVIPIGCAEEYFPVVSQPEGFPLTIEDIKGKEWTFQFRYWPNNESKLYVLEGVTSFMKSMQLQASDTVLFSRKEPEGKFVVGFRKSSKSSLQPMEGAIEIHKNTLSRQQDCDDGNVNLHNIANIGERTAEGLLTVPKKMTKRKKKGSKKKRFCDSQDPEHLRVAMQEQRTMLPPPQNTKLSIVVAKDTEIEAYEEPPVSGKDSAFAACSSGLSKQWVQCVSCSKWRTIPGDCRPSPEWKCVYNDWDPSRRSCSSPEETRPRELDNFLLLCNETEVAAKLKSLDIEEQG